MAKVVQADRNAIVVQLTEGDLPEQRPLHSPLGASSAERWMKCPGSVRLVQSFKLPETDEPDYRAEGTAAHAVLERCLRESLDAWELIGQKFGADITCTQEMAEAVQVFLDASKHPLTRAKEWIEAHTDNPDFHPLFYGTVDYGYLQDDPNFLLLCVDDFKYGQGIVVEAVGNPQIMYYAYGLLCMIAKEGIHPDFVRMRIIQPRAFHPDGVVREWNVEADVIIEWAEGTLRPAMERTEDDPALWPGDHCRFCPAKLVCPAMHGLVQAAVDVDTDKIPQWSNELADQTYPLKDALKHFIKAMEEDVLRRLSHGFTLSHAKLVHKKADRVFKPGAREVLELRLGKDAILTAPEMMSPAQIEKISPLAKDIVHEYAYTPESGLTVAPTSDKRVAVKVSPPSEQFEEFARVIEGK